MILKNNNIHIVNNIVSSTVLKLIFEEPFYGHILQSINRRITQSIPTAAVTLHNQKLELIINDSFFIDSLDENERVAVLKHELLHLVFKHLFRNEKYRENRLLYNLAADLVVNQYIGKWKLPKDAITLKSFPDIKLEAYETLDYYFEKLKDEDQSKLVQFIDIKWFLSHQIWDEMDSNSQIDNEVGKYNIDKIIIDSFDKAAHKKMIGNLPDDIIESINQIKSKFRSNINWRRSLRLFAQNSARSTIKITNKRVSKRFYTRPGIKIQRSEKILVALDTSGSITQEEINVFFTEIDKIYRLGAEIDIVECDAKVQAFYKYNGKTPDSITGRGGTEFDPVIEFLNESKVNYDGCIYLTDGYGYEPKIKPKKKLLWVVYSDIETDHLSTGKVIKLKINE